MKKLFVATFQLNDQAFQQLVYAINEEQVSKHFTEINKEASFKLISVKEVIDLTEQMNIVTSTSPSMGGHCINVSFITEYNGDTWTSQPYHLPIEVWNEQKETELKEEFKQFVLSKSTN